MFLVKIHHKVLLGDRTLDSVEKTFISNQCFDRWDFHTTKVVIRSFRM